MDGLGRRGAVERLAEGPRDAQDYREGLVLDRDRPRRGLARAPR